MDKKDFTAIKTYLEKKVTSLREALIESGVNNPNNPDADEMADRDLEMAIMIYYTAVEDLKVFKKEFKGKV